MASKQTGLPEAYTNTFKWPCECWRVGLDLIGLGNLNHQHQHPEQRLILLCLCALHTLQNYSFFARILYQLGRSLASHERCLNEKRFSQGTCASIISRAEGKNSPQKKRNGNDSRLHESLAPSLRQHSGFDLSR